VALPQSLLRRVDVIDADSVQAVQLVLRNGAVVDWGNAYASQRKAQVLRALLQRHAAHYDVSVPDAPAWSG
jgi:cell division protein FtsQ